MHKLLFGLLPIALLTGHAAANPSDSYRSVLKNYFACVLIHADRYATRSNEDAYYVALAARNACGSERLTAQEAVLAAERPAVANRIWKTYDDGVVEEMTARITRQRLD